MQDIYHQYVFFPDGSMGHGHGTKPYMATPTASTPAVTGAILFPSAPCPARQTYPQPPSQRKITMAWRPTTVQTVSASEIAAEVEGIVASLEADEVVFTRAM
jgi:hypothetical protein